MTKTLLIVDDDLLAVQTLEDVIGGDFDEVVHAWDGQEGIRVAMQRAPALVVLDMNMPRMDGLQTCERLREIPTLADVPIVIVTGEKSEQEAQKAFAKGANDYLVKPFSPSQIRARLRTWLLRDGLGHDT